MAFDGGVGSLHDFPSDAKHLRLIMALPIRKIRRVRHCRRGGAIYTKEFVLTNWATIHRIERISFSVTFPSRHTQQEKSLLFHLLS